MVDVRRGLLVLLLLAAGCTAEPASDERSASPPLTTTLTTASANETPTNTAVTSASHPTEAASSPTTSTVEQIPPISERARAAGLVDIRRIVPDAIVDLRYATTDNFVGVRLYPVDARCLVHRSMAPGLATAADRLRREGRLLVFWDCYRPHEAQVRMFEVVPDPNWVAAPGPYATSHEAARSVDVTLAHAAADRPCPAARRVQGHCLLDMGTDFDDFSPRAYAFATEDVSPLAQANRSRLREAMNAGGITVYEGEWWHFDGPGSDVERPHLDAPLT